jgi:hypothetical protein
MKSRRGEDLLISLLVLPGEGVFAPGPVLDGGKGVYAVARSEVKSEERHAGRQSDGRDRHRPADQQNGDAAYRAAR